MSAVPAERSAMVFSWSAPEKQKTATDAVCIVTVGTSEEVRTFLLNYGNSVPHREFTSIREKMHIKKLGFPAGVVEIQTIVRLGQAERRYELKPCLTAVVVGAVRNDVIVLV